MGEQRRALASGRIRRLVLCLGLILLAVWARALLWQAALQLFFGLMLALLAMPFMRRLEKKLPISLSASLSMMGVSGVFIGFLLLIVPLIIEQVRQLMSVLPVLYGQVGQWMQNGEVWLQENGMFVNMGVKETILGKAESLITNLLPATLQMAGGMMEKIGKVMLAPAFAFYFLRDRKRLGGLLLLWIPVDWRDTMVRVLREMRRETAGFLRGQLMVSAVVGVMTGLGLLFVGVPAWLLLGMLMGVLELIPYVGPFLGGAFVLLFALQGGMTQALWAMGIVILVQQLEGGVLSPQLMSDATRLHPVAVLLCVMLGGMAGGMMGILLAIPVLLCFRAALRVISLRMTELEQGAAKGFGEKRQNMKRAR